MLMRNLHLETYPPKINRICFPSVHVLETNEKRGLAPEEDPFSVEQIQQLLENQVTFERLGGTRAIYQCMDAELLLSINGENFALPLSDLEAVKQLTDFIEFDSSVLNATTPSLDFIETFTTLVNEGIWFS